ncbi:hypothetical protein SDC9_178470 [bioreactor metagenome]|uniref:Uncharacterized protein n=1 Tax=bioreactor metagenome TaxID=1076179 RepID=A0A645GZ44_9ZZZZ
MVRRMPLVLPPHHHLPDHVAAEQDEKQADRRNQPCDPIVLSTHGRQVIQGCHRDQLVLCFG